MRQLKTLAWAATLIGIWLLASSDTAPYDEWTPYFMDRAELEKSVFRASEPREMSNPGKIWIAPGTIYIVEKYKGVHVLDNIDPKNPKNVSFIVAPGCMDIAVKNNILFLDNAVDLVAFDLLGGKETKRLKNYFPEPVSPNGERYDNGSGLILVGWKKGANSQTSSRP